MKPDILIVTNGHKENWYAIEEGVWLASTLDSKITLLGLTEQLNPAAIDDHHPLEDVFEKAVRLFQERNVEYSLEVRNGSAEGIIPERAKQNESIIVMGPLGRPQFRRFLAGRSIHHFIEEIEQPILYIRQSKLPVKKILICVGGLGYDVNAENLAMQIAIKGQAAITLLHIVPPVELNYPTAQTISRNWQHLTDTDTPIGRSLRQSLENAKAEGVTAEVKVRQGNVVEEILSETKQGNYDLLCMGSSYSVHSLRQMSSANVTSEVTENASCPVLTARFKRDVSTF